MRSTDDLFTLSATETLELRAFIDEMLLTTAGTRIQMVGDGKNLARPWLRLSASWSRVSVVTAPVAVTLLLGVGELDRFLRPR